MENKPNSYSSMADQLSSYYLTLLNPIDQNADKGKKELHGFFHALYEQIGSKPERLGFEGYPPATFDRYFHNNDDKAFIKAREKTARVLFDLLEFVRNACCEGKLEGDSIVANKSHYDRFMKKNKRMKEKLLEGINRLGLAINADAKSTMMQSGNGMAKALYDLARGSCQFADTVERYVFASCDFDAIENKRVNHKLILSRIVKRESEQEYAYIADLCDHMADNGFVVKLRCENQILTSDISFFNEQLKQSSLVDISYNKFRRNEIMLKLKFISNSKWVPALMASEREDLKQNFFEISGKCNACGFCKGKDGKIRPHILQYNGRKKAVCYATYAEYSQIDAYTHHLIKAYVDVHMAM